MWRVNHSSDMLQDRMRHLSPIKGNSFMQAAEFPYSTKVRSASRMTGTVKLVDQRCKTSGKFPPNRITCVSMLHQDVMISRVYKVRTPKNIDMGSMAGYKVHSLVDIPHDKGILRDLASNPEKVIKGI